MKLPLELRLAHADGSWVPVEVVANNRLDDPAVAGIVMTIRDIRERKRMEALLTGHARVLEMVARREPLEATLDALATLIESYVVGREMCGRPARRGWAHASHCRPRPA